MPTEKFKKVSFKTKSGSMINFKAKQKRKKHNFPRNPKKGMKKTILVKPKGKVHGRYVTFKATGYSGKKLGKPKWIIVDNKPAY